MKPELLDEVPFAEIPEEEQHDIVNCVAAERYHQTGIDEDIVEVLSDALIPFVEVPVADIVTIDPPGEFMEATITQYAEAMRRGDEFPPIVVISRVLPPAYMDVVLGGGVIWEVCEGHHRYWAAERAGRETIRAWDVAPFVSEPS